VKASELRELTLDELATKMRETRNEFFGARVRFATGQLENTAKLRLLRRDVARIETLLRERASAAGTSEKGGASR